MKIFSASDKETRSIQPLQTRNPDRHDSTQSFETQMWSAWQSYNWPENIPQLSRSPRHDSRWRFILVFATQVYWNRSRDCVAPYKSLKPFPWSNNPALKENTVLGKRGPMNRLKAKRRLKQEAIVAAFDFLCRFVLAFPVTLCDKHCLHSQHSSNLISSRIIHLHLKMGFPATFYTVCMSPRFADVILSLVLC